jgi:hypothetical protein
MPRTLLFAALALATVASTARPVRAVTAGVVQVGAPVRVEIATIAGDFSTATIFELGNDKVRDVISVTAHSLEVQAVELTLSSHTRRLIVEVDVPQGGLVRVEVTAEGAPVFPTETIQADRRYVLEPL